MSETGRKNKTKKNHPFICWTRIIFLVIGTEAQTTINGNGRICWIRRFFFFWGVGTKTQATMNGDARVRYDIISATGKLTGMKGSWVGIRLREKL